MLTGLDDLSFAVKKLGVTRDDAVGEVFDKVSRLLGGPYPGGVWIGQQAKKCDLQAVQSAYPFAIDRFKRILLADTCDFSFSGMKSQAYSFIQRYKQFLNLGDDELLPELLVSYIAYEFQEAVADIVCTRVMQCIDQYDCDSFALVGWVSANIRIRERLQEEFDKKNLVSEKKLERCTPASFEYCTDNAAMIGLVGMVNVYE